MLTSERLTEKAAQRIATHEQFMNQYISRIQEELAREKAEAERSVAHRRYSSEAHDRRARVPSTPQGDAGRHEKHRSISPSHPARQVVFAPSSPTAIDTETWAKNADKGVDDRELPTSFVEGKLEVTINNRPTKSQVGHRRARTYSTDREATRSCHSHRTDRMAHAIGTDDWRALHFGHSSHT
jgi:hypothetical protein